MNSFILRYAVRCIMYSRRLHNNCKMLFRIIIQLFWIYYITCFSLEILEHRSAPNSRVRVSGVMPILSREYKMKLFGKWNEISEIILDLKPDARGGSTIYKLYLQISFYKQYFDIFTTYFLTWSEYTEEKIFVGRATSSPPIISLSKHFTMKPGESEDKLKEITLKSYLNN